MENSKRKSSINVINDEINYTELIDIGRKLVNGEDIKLGQHYITLALLSPNIDIHSKIQASAIKSYAHFKLKDERVCLAQVEKIFRFMKKNKLETFEANIILCIIRVLYRGGSLLIELKKKYTAAYLLYEAKRLFDLRQVREERESNLTTLDDTLKPLLKEITVDINTIKDNYVITEIKRDDLMEKIKKIKIFFTKPEQPTQNGALEDVKLETTKDDEIYYLISSVWVNNFVTFAEKIIKYSKHEKILDHLDKVFNRNFILNLYFSEDGNYEYSHYGIYPCEVNNFILLDFKDSWVDPDPDEQHSNLYLRKGIKEREDFFYVNQKEWNLINETFGCNYEIFRKIANISYDRLIEVFLKKMKILILNDKLRDKYIDLIKPRDIQISKEKNIKDLKNKILRCIKDYTEYEEMNNEYIPLVRLYLLNFGMKDNKKETFEMIYAFKNKFKIHNLIAEEVKDEEMTIENFKYGPGDLLVVEVDTNFVNIIKEQKVCVMCQKQIGAVYKCINCSTFIYCSESCRKEDEDHITYHANVNKLYKKKFNLQDLSQIKIEELLERSSRHGLVGLKNLGNTCFMNSALQCLSHCEDLTKYFLTRKAFDEINRNNSHGTGGEVAKAYYELIRQLWQGDSPYLCPTDFRQIFVRFVRQFAGFSQHDSHEMLTFMLDALHEDLNRVRLKPYIEMSEKSEKETEIEASTRWWKNHLSRENSIIVDLFHGQYKSVITCPECNRISITYDPFMYLGLPIPSGNFKIKFKFFNNANEIFIKNYFYEYDLAINDHTTVKDMKLKILSSKAIINIEYLEAVCLNKDKSFKRILREEELVFPFFDNGYEIVIYEKFHSTCKEKEVDNYTSIYLHPSEYVEERSMLFMKKSYQKLLSYPAIISSHKNNSIKDLYYYVFKCYRKILNIENKNFNLARFLDNQNNKEYVEEEFKFCFNTVEDNEPFKLHIINNISESNSYFTSKQNCEYCNSKCEYCAIPGESLSYKTTVKDLVNKQKEQRPVLVYVQFLKLSKGSKIFENMEFPINVGTKSLISKQSSINIYDCINLFKSEERLEKENAWYCSSCKSHQEAFKRLEIYKPPNFLIVQFKRFKIKTHSAVMGMIANKKNDVLIEYPVEGLDLREYVVGIEKEDAIYDLVGISQHYGGLSSGHYTALCSNSGKWYEFDDERVSKASNSDVITNSAYMLFYRKRTIGK